MKQLTMKLQMHTRRLALTALISSCALQFVTGCATTGYAPQAASPPPLPYNPANEAVMQSATDCAAREDSKMDAAAALILRTLADDAEQRGSRGGATFFRIVGNLVGP